MEDYLGNGGKAKDEEWTDSIAVGSGAFAEKVKVLFPRSAQCNSASGRVTTSEINVPG